MGLQFHPTSQPSTNSNPMNLDHISNYYPPLHSSNNHTLERQVSHGNASSHHTSSVSPQDLNLQNQAQGQNQSNMRGGPYTHQSNIGTGGYVQQNGQSQAYSVCGCDRALDLLTSRPRPTPILVLARLITMEMLVSQSHLM